MKMILSFLISSIMMNMGRRPQSNWKRKKRKGALSAPWN